MKIRLFTIIAALLVLSCISVVADERKGVLYFGFTNNFTDEWGYHSVQNNATGFTTDYAIYNKNGNGSTHAADLELTNKNFINITDADDLSFTDGSGTDRPFSISFWAKPESIAASFMLVAKYDSGAAEYLIQSGGAFVAAYVYSAGTTVNRLGRYTSGYKLEAGSWYHVVMTYSGSESASGIKIYINNTQRDNNDDNAGSYAGMSNTVAPLKVGARTASWVPEYTYDGIIDDVKIYNWTLNASEIAQIYENGSIYLAGAPVAGNVSMTAIDAVSSNPLTHFNATINGTFYTTTSGTISRTNVSSTVSYEVSAINYFNSSGTWNLTQNKQVNLTPYPQIQARDAYDNTSILAFVLQVENSTFCTNLSTTSGSVYAPYLGKFNLTVWNTTYFNKTVEQTLTGATVIIYPYQAVLNVQTYQAITGLRLYNLTARAPLQTNASENQVTLYLKAGTYNITANVSGYWNSTREITLAALEQKHENFTLGYARLNISAKNIFTSAAINSFSINLTRTDGDYVFSNVTSTTNGLAQLHLINGSYFVWIDAAGYAIQNATLTVDETTESYQFSLYTTNSILFTFKDEETQNIVNNVSVELIGSLFANNYSTTNGTLYVDLITPDDYSIRYNSPQGYTERFYYFTLTNRSYTNLTLYLVKNSTSTEITANVYDQGNNLVEDAYIKALRYDLATNAYILQEVAKTNFEGTTRMHLILNEEFYKFIIEYPLGTVLSETSPTYIYETTLNFQITIGQEIAENFYNSLDISYSLDFNNATNNFRYTYDDTNGVSSQGCLYVYRIDNFVETLYNSSCTPGAAATILLGVSNESGAWYRGDAYVTFSDGDYFLASHYKNFVESSGTGQLGVYLTIILTLVFVFVGYWNMAVALILVPLPALLMSIIGLIDISIMVTISLEIVAFIIALWIQKR